MMFFPAKCWARHDTQDNVRGNAYAYQVISCGPFVALTLKCHRALDLLENFLI